MIKKLHNTDDDLRILIDYLNEVDKDFEIPLSNKINLTEFAKKTLSKGHAFIVKERGEYLGLSTVYCNNYQEHRAFLPILSVKESCRGKGYARMLVNDVINISRLYGMHTICVDSVNPIAVALYKSMGFQCIKQEKCNGVIKEYLGLTIPSLKELDLLELLTEIDADYNPRLSSKVSLDMYVSKIKSQADIMVETDRDGICGIVVFYCNDLNKKIAYIPLVGVAFRKRSQGIASRLVQTVCDYIQFKQFRVIGIHSNNALAINMYKKLGFKIILDEERKYMEMSLN